MYRGALLSSHGGTRVCVSRALRGRERKGGPEVSIGGESGGYKLCAAPSLVVVETEVSN